MEITFNAPTDITIVPELKRTYNSIIIEQMVEYPEQKRVAVQIREIGMVTLWQGAAYDAIGQWTDTDVENRLKEIYGN